MGCLSKNREREDYKLPPKVVVLREEFVALTQEPLVAIVLGQLLYWTQRVKDFDLFLKEEKFFNPDCKAVLRHGWIYKTANDLIEETMICVDRTTMRRYLKTLMDRGWLEERSHPTHRWDKTSQYRLNLRKLQEDLLPLGFELPGIDLLLRQEFIHKNDDEEDDSKEFDDEELISDISEMAEFSKGDFAPSKEQNISCLKKSAENPRVQNAPSKGYNPPSKEEIDPSNVINSPLYIQRLQTENINREQQQDACVRENFSEFENSKNLNSENFHSTSSAPQDKSIAAEMLEFWQQHVEQHFPPESKSKRFRLTKAGEDKLESLFAFHFKNDMPLWKKFCLQVKASSFLMGDGGRTWHVDLDWTLREGNVSKILSGKYDNSHKPNQEDSFEVKLEKIQSPSLTAEKAAIVSSIKDPIWRQWCSRLAEGVQFNDHKMLHEPFSLVDLQHIVNARFLECEDERLVWIGSNDPGVLNAIEKLRLQISWVYAKEYPKARSIRTRLDSQPCFSVPQSLSQGETHHD